MAHTVNIVNAFVDEGKGGNPAGVVLDADALSSAEKLRIAQLVGLSETAFVSRSQVAGIKLEFFTPSRQIAHCGHATIATFSLLAQRGLVTGPESSKETIDGTRRIFLRGSEAYMEQLAPTYIDEAIFPPGVSANRILASLGLTPGRVAAPPCVVGTGNRFVLVHVRSEAQLAELSPDMKEIAAVSEAFGAIGYYVFATTDGEFAATARMFGPCYGIEEEAATGMAAGPLACYLYDRAGLKRAEMLIRQGAYMATPSPSRITVELKLEQGRIVGLFAGGMAKLASSITVM
ncbi:PhzF family phenazine biosynthesis protein [Massilia sp. IC2-477]|uniref:PhzF family phenazine biosynthesis protein n=1 Tax=Massilia sp. IC2-477 TaxID=2887198 RepID=UPI001D12F711|nr:PhzF family phenazine biosynthesis protein [Massilia sp. IC2-477]MCC2956348.1 PhzF family phenazine biosynthesis protein [Massilia sp. IC2-477]